MSDKSTEEPNVKKKENSKQFISVGCAAYRTH